MGGAGEIVVYLPNGGGRATADIVRGSAIVGPPDSGSDRVTIYLAEGHEWVAGDGRRTSAVDEALLWALESIAQEKG